MKNNKIVYLKGFAFILFFSMLTSLAVSQTRNTLWLDGLSTTSLGWESTPEFMRDIHDYDLFNVISLQGLPNSTYQPGLGTFAAAAQLNTSLSTAGYENILGIGHDFGGLVLRGMAGTTTNLTAMILDGVPNQGSHGIRFAIESLGVDGLSKAQRIVNGVQAIKAGENCIDCQLVETFEMWINELETNQAIYSEMLPNSDVINTLAFNPPTIPFAVMFGTKENLSITSLMSSWFFSGTGDEDHFTKCYTESLERARDEAKEEFIISTIDNTLGFFDGVVQLLKGIFPSGGPPVPFGTALNSITDHINDKKDDIINELNAIKERDEELARILRCEIANQLLATEWQLALAENGPFETIEVSSAPTYNQCLDQCNEEGWEDPYLYFICIPECMNEVTIVTVFVAEDNDGLLSVSEQLLSGAVDDFHLSETNHFQESKKSNDLLIDHLSDLFDGNSGAAFVVPMQ